MSRGESVQQQHVRMLLVCVLVLTSLKEDCTPASFRSRQPQPFLVSVAEALSYQQFQSAPHNQLLLSLLQLVHCRVDYSLALLILGFVVTLIGQGSTYWLMARVQRRSIVIIAMASLMLLATVTMYYESVVTFLDALHQHRLSERGHICTEK